MAKTKIVVVGNCQARPLAMAFEKLSDKVVVTTIAIVHLLQSEQFEEYREDFENADFIIAQLVADNYHCDFVRTNFLKERYGNKVISIINLYFTGYTPDWFYIRIPGQGPLRGPMGDYHNKTILESWKRGLPVDEAKKLLLDVSYNARYLNEKDQSLFELSVREAKADVKIVDYITREMMNSRLFFVFNHPSANLLVAYAKRILSKIYIDFSDLIIDFDGKEPLSIFSPLVNPVADFIESDSYYSFGVDIDIKDGTIVMGPSVRYCPKNLVAKFYDVYDFFKSDIKFLQAISKE